MGFGLSSLPIYLVEVAPKGRETAFGSLFSMSVNFGVVLTLAASTEFTLGKVNLWQYFMMFGGVFPLLQLLMIFVSTESPGYFDRSGQKKKAASVRYALHNYEDINDLVDDENFENFYINYFSKIKETFIKKTVRSSLFSCLLFRVQSEL